MQIRDHLQNRRNGLRVPLQLGAHRIELTHIGSERASERVQASNAAALSQVKCEFGLRNRWVLAADGNVESLGRRLGDCHAGATSTNSASRAGQCEIGVAAGIESELGNLISSCRMMPCPP